MKYICDKNHPDDDGEAACVKALAELIRFSRNTDSELPDRVLARLFLDGMCACEEDLAAGYAQGWTAVSH